LKTDPNYEIYKQLILKKQNFSELAATESNCIDRNHFFQTIKTSIANNHEFDLSALLRAVNEITVSFQRMTIDMHTWK